jgi:hypothetical protein
MTATDFKKAGSGDGVSNFRLALERIVIGLPFLKSVV